ncbi:MAG: hypothetical protein JWP03_1707 [Phycisphaerales bacterium]|nr:hypothetical protein [Phycisphaerales bacterium]
MPTKDKPGEVLAAPLPSRDRPYAEDRDVVIWVTCVAAAGIGLWIARDSTPLYDAANPARSIGGLLGAFFGSFVFSFLIGFIVAKIALRLIGRRPWVGRTGFALGACLVMAIVAIGEHRIRGFTSRSSSTGKETTPQRIVSNAETKTLLTNEGRAYLALVTRRNEQYAADTANIIGDGLIRPARLDTAEKLTALRAKLARLRQLTDDFETSGRTASEALLQHVEAMPIAEAEKQSFATSYWQSRRTSLANENEMLSLSRQLFDAFDKLADFMAARLGAFRVEDNTLVFKSAEDLAGYNQIVTRLTDIAKREQESAAHAKKMMQQSADEMDRM